MVGSNRPQLFVIAGPNGAGKSTVATELLPESLRVRQFVNADSIAAGLSPFAPETAAFLAGRVMLKRIRELFNYREDFAIETTLAGRMYESFLVEARQAGYMIHLVYLWLNSAELACTRVGDRVRQGGHGIPEETIRRRYARSISNFIHRYRSLADTWILFDNSGESLAIIARGTMGGDDEIVEEEPFRRILESIKHAGNLP